MAMTTQKEEPKLHDLSPERAYMLGQSDCRQALLTELEEWVEKQKREINGPGAGDMWSDRDFNEAITTVLTHLQSLKDNHAK